MQGGVWGMPITPRVSYAQHQDGFQVINRARVPEGLGLGLGRLRVRVRLGVQKGMLGYTKGCGVITSAWASTSNRNPKPNPNPNPKVLRPALGQMAMYLQPWGHLLQTMIDPIHANIEARTLTLTLTLQIYVTLTLSLSALGQSWSDGTFWKSQTPSTRV